MPVTMERSRPRYANDLAALLRKQSLGMALRMSASVKGGGLARARPSCESRDESPGQTTKSAPSREKQTANGMHLCELDSQHPALGARRPVPCMARARVRLAGTPSAAVAPGTSPAATIESWL